MHLLARSTRVHPPPPGQHLYTSIASDSWWILHDQLALHWLHLTAPMLVSRSRSQPTALVGVAKGAGKGGLQLGTRLLRRRLGAGLAFAHAAGVRREGSGSTRVGGRKAATAVGLWLLGSRGALHGTPHSASTLCLGCRGKDLLATDRDSHLVPSQLLPRCWWVYRCWNRFHTLEQRRFVERTPQNLKARAPLDTALVSYGDECAM